MATRMPNATFRWYAFRVEASCGLEAGVRIYATRVDSVHSQAFKVLAGSVVAQTLRTRWMGLRMQKKRLWMRKGVSRSLKGALIKNGICRGSPISAQPSTV